MITTSDSLFRERDAQSNGRRFAARHVRFRAFPRANRIRLTANSPNRCATSSTAERQVSWPWPPWQCFYVDALPGAHTDAASPGCTVRLLALLLPASSATTHCLAY